MANMIRLHDAEFDISTRALPQEYNRWLQLNQKNGLTELEQAEKRRIELTALRRHLEAVAHLIDSELKEI
jgi:hypothetical protein